jgi:hypothetical protein
MGGGNKNHLLNHLLGLIDLLLLTKEVLNEGEPMANSYSSELSLPDNYQVAPLFPAQHYMYMYIKINSRI